MSMTRREFGRLAAAAPAVLLGAPAPAQARQAVKPDSRWAGVQVGMNVPYNFGTGNVVAADELLRLILETGVSAVEMRAQPVELFMGSPGLATRGVPADQVRQWRLAAPTSRIAEFRRLYEDAGVAIQILKIDGLFTLSDDELDYFFQMARDLGARALSAEISPDVSMTKRIGQFADKHRIMVGYHGHTETGPRQWEEAFGYARYNGANLDLGHFVAGHNTSPVPFLTAHHDRITHVHVKDRKLGTNGGQNMPFGQGDTPITEVLQLIRDQGWNIQATIEFEYPVPPGSTRMEELKKTVDYCKRALVD